MAKIFHADLVGDRQHKFDVFLANDISTTDWVELHPEALFYLFKPYHTDLLPEYNQGFKITEMMPINSVGIVTGKDAETIAFSYEEGEELCQKHDIHQPK